MKFDFLRNFQRFLQLYPQQLDMMVCALHTEEVLKLFTSHLIRLHWITQFVVKSSYVRRAEDEVVGLRVESMMLGMERMKKLLLLRARENPELKWSTGKIQSSKGFQVNEWVRVERRRKKRSLKPYQSFNIFSKIMMMGPGYNGRWVW